MTIPELADQLKVSIGKVRQWEKGKILDPLDAWSISKWHAEEIPPGLLKRDQFLGDKIVERRIRCGMSRRELAKELGVSEHAVRIWEEGAMPKSSGMRSLNEWFAEELPEIPVLNYADIGKVIDERRQEWGWTLKRLAEHLGVNEQTVGHWVKGRAQPRVTFLKRISSWLSEPAPAEDAPDSQAEIIELAQRMREKMQSTGIRPLELSKILGVDVVSIKAWEGGWGLPDANVIEFISEWLSEKTPQRATAECEGIGTEIRTMRLKRGLNQERLGGLLGVDHNTLNNWEKGKEIPNDFFMIRIEAWLSEELMTRRPIRTRRRASR